MRSAARYDAGCGASPACRNVAVQRGGASADAPRHGGTFQLSTADRTYTARQVIVATGCGSPSAPDWAAACRTRRPPVSTSRRSLQTAGVGFLDVPGVLRGGRVIHIRGITDVPGLYFLGGPGGTPAARAARRAEQRDVAVEAVRRYNPDAVVVVGVPFGHTRPQWILPHGGTVVVDGRPAAAVGRLLLTPHCGAHSGR